MWWWWHPATQTGMMNQSLHGGIEQAEQSRSVAQGSYHENDSNQSGSPAAISSSDTERAVDSNPFVTLPKYARRPDEKSLAAPDDSQYAPDPRPKRYHSLANGARLGDDAETNNGHGKLSVSNRTDLDAVVRLYNRVTQETVRWFFVKANSSCTVNSIPQGDYVLAYTSGLDWIDSEEAFRWHPSYHEFDRTVSYSEQTDASGIQYEEFSVTLHPVFGGNIRAKVISRSDFLKGHRHPPL
jgi:hypothetical protein